MNYLDKLFSIENLKQVKSNFDIILLKEFEQLLK